MSNKISIVTEYAFDDLIEVEFYDGRIIAKDDNHAKDLWMEGIFDFNLNTTPEDTEGYDDLLIALYSTEESQRIKRVRVTGCNGSNYIDLQPAVNNDVLIWKRLKLSDLSDGAQKSAKVFRDARAKELTNHRRRSPQV